MQNTQTIVENILNVFQNYRMQPSPIDVYEQTGKEVLRNKLSPFVAANKPIEFVMLGFPFKSTNTRDKVFGVVPDMAEEVTLKNFEKFNQDVKSIYSQGVEINIVSDGYVFNDLLKVSDNVVEEYKQISLDMGKNAPIKWLDLQDFYTGGDLVVKRDKVMKNFGITAEKLESDILTNADVNYLYRGMVIFMREELAMHTFPSQNQWQKAAKLLAREMMFRNEAYSNLVKKEFSNHIRLSMHPSINDGNKYSFQLIPGNHAKHSAWHCTLLVDGENYVTIHRKDALEMGLQPVYKNGQPYNFEINR